VLNIISKNIIALKSNPLINEYPFDEVQNWLNGIHPKSPQKKRYDTREPKKTTFELGLGLGRGMDDGATGLGLNTNKANEGTTSSWYNDPSKPPDDEVGPGNKSTNWATMREGDQPGDSYLAQDMNNELFMDLRVKNDGKRDSRSSSLRNILMDKPVVLPHRRYKPQT
jgi:hypothetical protein